MWGEIQIMKITIHPEKIIFNLEKKLTSIPTKKVILFKRALKKLIDEENIVEFVGIDMQKDGPYITKTQMCQTKVNGVKKYVEQVDMFKKV